jgi:hypothetical protein
MMEALEEEDAEDAFPFTEGVILSLFHQLSGTEGRCRAAKGGERWAMPGRRKGERM